MMARSSCLPVLRVTDTVRSMSLSSLSPSGVISNTQENTRNSGKPMASRMTTTRAGVSPKPNSGNRVVATSLSNHAAAR